MAKESRVLSFFLICLLWPFLNGKAVRFSCPTAILCWTLILSDSLCDFLAPYIYCPISSPALQLGEKNLRLLMLNPLCGLGWFWSYQARSQPYQQTLAGLCLSRGPREWKCWWSLSVWHFSLFLHQNQCERSFSAPLWVKGGQVGRGKGMEKYSADEKLFAQFFLPAVSIYRFN